MGINEISVIATGKEAAKSEEVSNPTFKDEEGKLYVAALFKEMTENTITVDVIEFITYDDAERIKELNLTENEMPDGYYIYNQDTETVTWNLDSQTVYRFIDWNGDFIGFEYPEEYTTTDLQEFRKYIGTYQDAAPGIAGSVSFSILFVVFTNKAYFAQAFPEQSWLRLLPTMQLSMIYDGSLILVDYLFTLLLSLVAIVVIFFACIILIHRVEL